MNEQNRELVKIKVLIPGVIFELWKRGAKYLTPMELRDIIRKDGEPMRSLAEIEFLRRIGSN